MTTEINADMAPLTTAHAAHTTVPLHDLTHAPLATHSLSDQSKRDLETLILRAAEREKIETPEALTPFMAQMKARFAALMASIGPDSKATHVFGHRFDADYKTHVAEGREHAMAMQDVQSIFLNRAADINAMLPLFEDAAFTAGIAGKLSAPAPELHTTLSDAKRDEIKAALTADGKGGIDAPAHFKRNFLEHHTFHAALMDAFTKGSDVAEALATSLDEALPADAKPARDAWLNDWLTLRAERARGVMEATRPDGMLAQTAVAEWDAARTRPHAPAAAHAAKEAATPSPVIDAASDIYKEMLKEVANENAAAPSAASR